MSISFISASSVVAAAAADGAVSLAVLAAAVERLARPPLVAGDWAADDDGAIDGSANR